MSRVFSVRAQVPEGSPGFDHVARVLDELLTGLNDLVTTNPVRPDSLTLSLDVTDLDSFGPGPVQRLRTWTLSVEEA